MQVIEGMNMPIKAKPFKHQIEAYNFACEKMGLPMDNSAVDMNSEEVIERYISRSNGIALLMEMG